MAAQFIDVGGKTMAVMPAADHDRPGAHAEGRAEEQAAGRRAGTGKAPRKLAGAFDVDVDDILPRDAE